MLGVYTAPMTDMLSAARVSTGEPVMLQPGERVVRQARGLRLTFVPTWSLVAQVLGAVAVLAAIVGLTHSPWWAVLAGGIGAIALGALHEAGLLSAAEKT